MTFGFKGNGILFSWLSVGGLSSALCCAAMVSRWLADFLLYIDSGRKS